jgi:hypothetical protein
LIESINAGGIRFYTGNGTQTERLRIDVSGNVGIGTSNPAQKLHVVGAVYGTTYGQFGTAVASGTNASFAVFGSNSAVVGVKLVLDSDVNRNDLVVATTGNIGIGTNNPGYKLQVNSGGIAYLAAQGNALVMGDDATYGASGTGRYVALGYGGLSNGANKIFAHNTGEDGIYICSATSRNINFRPGGGATDYVVITSVGNVGIGITSPTQKLHVLTTGGSTTAPNIVATFQANTATTILAGGGTAIKFVGVSSGGNLQDYDQGMISTLGYADNNRHGMQFWVKPNASTVLTVGQTIDSNGNVGIGTTSPGCKFAVIGETQISSSSAYTTHLNYNDAGTNFITTANTGYTYFRGSSNNVTTMTVTGGGNVGIGTTTVRANLHLNGDFIRDSNIPYSWGTSAPFRTFSGAYSYANGGVNGPNRYLLLWPQITSTNGQNGRFVNAKLIVSRGATHAYNDTTIGEIVASAGYNSSANLYSYTPLIGEKLYFYNVVYNSVTYLAISLPISDFRWELSGHFGIEETAYYSPTFVYSNTSGVGTITQLTTYTNESLAIYNNGGNIGINTTTPTYKLDVNGSINTSTFMYVSYQYGDAYPLQLVGSNFLKANSNYYGLLIRSGDTNFISGRLSLIGGSSKRLEVYGYEQTVGYIPTVIPGGNVGIGTTSPTQKLHVAGDALIASSATAGNLYFGATDLYIRRDNSYDLSLVQAGDSNSGLYLVSAGSVYLNIDSNNNDTDKAFIVQNNALKAGTELFRVQENGNVGIGTTSPTQKLEVNGTIKATSFVGSFSKTSTTQTITGNSALTIDVSAAYIHIITVAASGGVFGISSVTYNNRKAGPEVDEIILIFKWPASGSGVITISNTIGDIPFNYGKATVSRLTSYKGTTGLWIAETVASNIDYTNL